MLDINNFDILKIGLATSDQIRSWSRGEVKKPETINYRTLKPEKDGLFCEKTFGPSKDWECYCGKYKRLRFKGIICERCGVEVTRSRVRRERMGHIELAAPVAHIWYFKGVPTRMGYLLDISPKDLEKIIYFASYIITHLDDDKRHQELPVLEEELNEDIAEIEAAAAERLAEMREELANPPEPEPEPEEEEEEEELAEGEERPVKVVVPPKTPAQREREIKDLEESTKTRIERLKEVFKEFKDLKYMQLVQDETLFRDMRDRYGDFFRGAMGAEAIRELLSGIDLDDLVAELRETLKNSKGQKRQKAIKRLKVAASFLHTDNKPTSMVMEVIPVIPPDLRPMVQLDGGRFATSDLNDLYRRVINRNNRLKRLLDLGAPEIIVNNEKRMLQEAVDALFDNGRRGRAVTGPGNRPLKSLSDMLKGKQGRFRQNLLGKRVDYSGRSVIVVGPELRLHQCGLPKQMALELFKPFVMKRLVDRGYAQNIKSAKRMVERQRAEVWEVLEEVIKEHPVLLNRAPTLHRLGIQAFEPVLVEGKAIQIHPLVCTAFNADFDGDQMAVHLPLSAEAQAEARILMLSAHNILSPAHGRPITTPTQDMVLGVNYLTVMKEGERGEGKAFNTAEEAIMAYEYGDVELHAKVKVRVKERGRPVKLIETTVGRVIFNQALPDDYPFVNDVVSKKEISELVTDCAKRYDRLKMSETLDAIKEVTFHYATRAGITISVQDITVPPAKESILEKTESKIQEVETKFKRGLITEEERHQEVVELWTEATDDVAEAMKTSFDEFNPIYMMANSGARGNIKQLRQLAGMRGLMANPKGDIIDRPIKSNFRDGLTVLEYFISTHGARKGLADTALRTADSGYLTRRLVDVAQDVIIREDDCGTDKGIPCPVFNERDESNNSLRARVALEDVVDPGTGEVIVEKNQQIDEEAAAVLEEAVVKNQERIDNALQSRKGLARVVDPWTGRVLVEEGKAMDRKIDERIKRARRGEVMVRSLMTCEARNGVCALCYGGMLATGKLVEIGEAVGIIAAQSIGEPGTQLTMRTFHTGGVAGEDITHGLPRVVELFEARKPKGQAAIAEISGTVISEATENVRVIHVRDIDREQLKEIREAMAAQGLYLSDDEHREPGGKAKLDKKESIDGVKLPAAVRELLKAAEIEKVEQLTALSLVDLINLLPFEREKNYKIPRRIRLMVRQGQEVAAGDQLGDGHISPQELLHIKGIQDVQLYLVTEVQDVYKSQGVDIHDKHVELIVRQMLKRVKITKQGDTDMLPGELKTEIEFRDKNEAVRAESGEAATADPQLLGITKASLATESFLSAASFQETTRVLTDAAISNREDPLLGLKENVIIGKLIPAGTGMGRYRNIKVKAKSTGISLQDEVDALRAVGGFPEETFSAEQLLAAMKPRSERGEPIDHLELPTRTRNNLVLAGFERADQLAALTVKELLGVPNIGEKAVEEVAVALQSVGLALRPAESEEPLDPEVAQLLADLDELDISTRTRNNLRESGIERIGQLTAYNAAELLDLPNIGEKALEEIEEALEGRGLTLTAPEEEEAGEEEGPARVDTIGS